MDRTRMTDIDRISDLPCDVIYNILRYLPLRDAARTSVLSREWRHKWKYVTHLVFDAKFQKNIIYLILFLHKGPIVEFTLEDADVFLLAIKDWFSLLSKHRIEKLKLQFVRLSSLHAPSYHLFSFDHLTHLHLANANFGCPSGFKGFHKLVSLDLVNIHILPGELKEFISKCPVLEYINLHSEHRSTAGDYEIDAPSLKSFCFMGILRSICFQNTSLLEKVSITLDEDASVKVFEDLESNSIEFFRGLSSIKRLKLNGDFLKFLGRIRPPLNLPADLSHVTVLDLFDVDFGVMAEVTCALCLIRSLPNLQTLQFKAVIPRDTPSHIAMFATYYLKLQRRCGLTLSHLENVKIVDFSYSCAERQFVKLILSATTALRNLEILPKYKPVSARRSHLRFQQVGKTPSRITRSRNPFLKIVMILKCLFGWLLRKFGCESSFESENYEL